MNTSDSELVARILGDAGYDPGADGVGPDTDAVLINTCAISTHRSRLRCAPGRGRPPAAARAGTPGPPFGLARERRAAAAPASNPGPSRLAPMRRARRQGGR
ncbi:hypothetical protein MNEG_15356 [Monoraphidium neglectum]|uniref:Uncharacterized protein n=1 Tax=Monoraphidium neglectum TaxID=145388 RepID=A0A0D2LLA1_9CHLO|nr:hypothetical protein MNEG_15356 [Monoraphidium neglectum]KIY92609.1 hypothetical protein MNEG_15356 [Monoraphidium neglectum]|eukprot:XP_013891629.1 hypothetical protein MNEG_15356 [Monoraphidium neglectum]